MCYKTRGFSNTPRGSEAQDEGHAQTPSHPRAQYLPQLSQWHEGLGAKNDQVMPPFKLR